MSVRSVALLLATGGALVAAAPAQACSVPITPERFDRAPRAVFGHVVWVHRTPGRLGGARRTFRATIRVSRIYKGPRSPLVRVRGIDGGGGDCTMAAPRVGGEIALYLPASGSPFTIALPALTTRGELDRFSGGRYTRPAD